MENSREKKFMSLALKEGAKALARGDYPVGAILVLNGKVIGKMNNALLSRNTWGDHAETQLLLKHSRVIRKSQKNKKTKVELYCTLEPCLMCLGCAMLHRVDTLVFSCPDPRGGAANLQLHNLPSFYHDNLPKIKSGIFREESYNMFKKFIATQSSKRWKINKILFEKMAAQWN